MIVSVSFQFVGFLLTYVLHTTHAAKYGSRVGLGITLIQFGLTLRSRAEALLETGEFPTDPADPEPQGTNADELEAENAIHALYGPDVTWPIPIRDPLLGPDEPPRLLHNIHEAEIYAIQHNTTLVRLFQLPSAGDIGRANEWFSFLLMSIGWFLVLTSLGGWWRVKRFERGLLNAQRESEAAQAAANGGDESEANISISVPTPGPTSLSYYTSAFSQAASGVRELQRGFLGMRGPHIGRRGGGHAPLPTDDQELDFLGQPPGLGGRIRFGLAGAVEPMAGVDGDTARGRGLWA